MKPVRPVRRRRANPLVIRGVEAVHWTDVALLRTFVSDRGTIRSRRVTGLTGQQQRQIATAIENAREMALLPYTSSPTPSSARERLRATPSW